MEKLFNPINMYSICKNDLKSLGKVFSIWALSHLAWFETCLQFEITISHP